MGSPDHRQEVAAELDRLYRVEGASMAVIAQRYSRSQSWVKDQLIAAGIPIRPRGQVAGPRPPVQDSQRRGEQIRRDTETAQVAELYVHQELSLEVIGHRYGHTPDWVKVRLREAGVMLRPPGRHRPADVQARVRELLDQGLRVSQIADRLGYDSDWPILQILSAHGWSAPPRRPRGPTRALPPLSTEVLRELHLGQGLTVPEIALQLGVTRHQVRKTLRENRISQPRPGWTDQGPPAPIDLAQLEELYRVRRLTAAQVAEALHTTTARVVAALRRAGIDRRPGRPAPPPPVPIDHGTLTDLYVRQRLDDAQIGSRYQVPADRIRRRRRELGVVRARPTGSRPHPAPPPEVLRRHYDGDKLTLAQIGKLYRTSSRVVRDWLVQAGIQVAPRTTRATRRQLDIDLLRQLYVDRGWSAEQIAVDLHTTVAVVLRTLHEQGIAVRPGGPPPNDRTAPSVDPRLVALYQDAEVTDLLRRYRIPRREQPGTITARFPTPVPISERFLRDAYLTVGLSCQHVEWLTGQPAEKVLQLLHDHQIPVRGPGSFSPWLLRYRREVRAAT